MDGTLVGLSGTHIGTVLQRFIIERPVARRALYWRDAQADEGGTPSVLAEGVGVLSVSDGGTVSFDTYFNSFFEAQWLRFTTLQTLNVEITLSGTARLRVWRHALGRKVVLCEQQASPGVNRVALPLPCLNFRQHGALSVELTATDGSFSLLSGAWTTDDRPVMETGLAAVFCTFNREAEISRVIASIGADDAVATRLAQVYVVNQGRPGLHHHAEFADGADLLGDRLTVIEQQNFGGAGGFSRGLLAALADPAVTHAVLLDDDLELEPDSLLRMAAFFSFCAREVVVGGHMLDLLHPTTLYEAGAVISEREWAFLPQHFATEIDKPDILERLSRPYPVHYTGWWCCGFPISVLRQHGMPLPCFIRGDDLEFGLRLHERGIPILPMPGIAVWHEPFYLKLGSWQLYYETRNMLVAMALHKPHAPAAVVRRMGRQVVNHLLTYRYYSTALILRGIEDFLSGPAVMREMPLARHRGLDALKRHFPVASTRRDRVAYEQGVKPVPLGRTRCLGLLGWLLLRNALLGSCQAPARRMEVEKLHWLVIRDAGHIALETWWDEEMPTVRRTRDQHRKLLWQAAGLLLRLHRELPAVAEQWRQAAPVLTSVPFWQRYLGVEAGNAGGQAVQGPAVEALAGE